MTRRLKMSMWQGQLLKYVARTITEEPLVLQDKPGMVKWDPPRSKFRDQDIQI